MGRPTLFFTSSLLLGGLCSFAVASSATSDADLLRVLEQKGYLTSAEVEELRSARSSERASEGIVVTTPGNHVVDLQISGALQFQYDGISASHRFGKAENKVGFRHVFLGISATLPNDWYVRGALDFGNTTGTGNNLDHMFVGWKNSKELDVSVGYGKVPFGYETTTAPTDVLTIEASPVANFFADALEFNSFHAGAWVTGELEGGFSYTVSVANGEQGYHGNGGNGYSVWGRVQYTTDQVESPIGNGTLMIGADIGYQNSNQSLSGPSYNPSIFGYTGYARLTLADLTMIGELTGATIEGGNGFNRANPLGVTATVYYTIDQFQPIFQYGFIDGGGLAFAPSDVAYAAPFANTAVNRMHSVYLGSNYYIMGNDLRLSAGIVYLGSPSNGVNESYDAVGVRAQLQVQF